ncbi:hypothetical protein LEP1GSC173_3531 [Leptospira interrogans str. HAI1594]|nr:hypothetical protein LEP1GSC080_4470 [Leptospira interrogans str. FPW2026]EKP24023.1 hypothetical protein LEP1GSC117_0641 [Leptospira interrogans serovar Icterohaemorrhagiae str. Verdun LP]EKP78306.1 hypothetical protein LEP1GSC173_3531 [Leptospira interrogans str. HAI1594]EMN68393.1 hypothetical protein LEP1GSC098_2489 [Leptospira interrogans serovar Grippotyphosa str. UI 08434]EMO19284.1 hypothetical protein LEP1GSC167_4086 [Leptospira interrogans serovar Copenhageni str. HAI0188]EMO35575
MEFFNNSIVNFLLEKYEYHSILQKDSFLKRSIKSKKNHN